MPAGAAAHITDACIIGAGPMGIFAIFQLGLADLRCHVVDRLDNVGGQCAALYPEKPVYDIPSWPEISGQALVDRLMLQIRPFAAQFHLGCTARRVAPRAPCAALPVGGWRVETDAEAIDCRVVVIATGDSRLAPGKLAFSGRDVVYGTGARTIPVDPASFRSATPGIFAIGDVADYPGKLKLILSGFHEAALMAQAAFRICHPQKKLRFQYTTSSSSLQKKLGV